PAVPTGTHRRHVPGGHPTPERAAQESGRESPRRRRYDRPPRRRPARPGGGVRDRSPNSLPAPTSTFRATDPARRPEGPGAEEGRPGRARTAHGGDRPARDRRRMGRATLGDRGPDAVKNGGGVN